MTVDVRRFGYSHVISSGNEAVVNAAAYIEWLAGDPKTGVIALFSETIHQPERFVAALDKAAAAGKPVVVLKVGKSHRTRAAITTHTGCLAGESRVLSEVLRTHRAIEVSDLDDMTGVPGNPPAAGAPPCRDHRVRRAGRTDPRSRRIGGHQS